MPKNRLNLLTDAKIRNLKPQGNDNFINDGGGLYLRARLANGSREWVFRYTSPLTLKRSKKGLGQYPDVSLTQARQIASDMRVHVDKGQDPRVEHHRQVKEDAKRHVSEQERERQTINYVFSLWKKQELQNRKDEGAEVERAFEKDVFPLIGTRPIREVTKQDIMDVLHKPLNRKVRRMANRLLSDLKQFFGFAVDEEFIEHDPTFRLKKERVGGIQKSRSRYLSADDLATLAQQLPKSKLETIYQNAFWLLLATCCRVDELARAKWADIDWKEKTWTIPAEHAKNGTKHTVYLSDFSIQHFRALEEKKYNAWVFPNRTGEGCIHRQTISKQMFDRQCEEKKRIKGRTAKASSSLLLKSGRWKVHDLRRTAATLMQDLNVMPHIIKKCMNHKTEDRMMETYQRADLIEKQKEAFSLLGAHLSAAYQRVSP